jgi:PhnB protein
VGKGAKALSIKTVNPYILLNGTAQAAIGFYESALGAKTESIMHFGEVPAMNAPTEQKDLIIHAVMRVGGGVIMLSDAPPNQTIPPGGNIQITLDFSDFAEMSKAFDALASGGKVVMPLADTFWGAKFGMVTDRFGVGWMLNSDMKKAEA